MEFSMKTQAQRLPVDVKVTDLEKLRDTRAQKRAEDESFSYNPQRLGMFRRELVAQVLGNSDISDLRGHRHALSIEARSKFKRLLDDIKTHIKAAEHKAAIK
jgi:hypothetical protein